MSYKVKILPEAHRDIRESIKWYNKQKDDLGKRFYIAVKSRIASIKENPGHYQIRYRQVHGAPIKKFPFSLYYKIDKPKSTIIIFAVIHSSRNPEIWKRRQS